MQVMFGDLHVMKIPSSTICLPLTTHWHCWPTHQVSYWRSGNDTDKAERSSSRLKQIEADTGADGYLFSEQCPGGRDR